MDDEDLWVEQLLEDQQLHREMDEALDESLDMAEPVPPGYVRDALIRDELVDADGWPTRRGYRLVSIGRSMGGMPEPGRLWGRHLGRLSAALACSLDALRLVAQAATKAHRDMAEVGEVLRQVEARRPARGLPDALARWRGQGPLDP